MKRLRVIKNFLTIPCVSLLVLSSLIEAQPKATAQTVNSIRYNAQQFNKTTSLPAKDRRAGKIASRSKTVQTPKGRAAVQDALRKQNISKRQMQEAAHRRALFTHFKTVVDRFRQLRTTAPARAQELARSAVDFFNTKLPAEYKQAGQRYLATYGLSLPILQADSRVTPIVEKPPVTTPPVIIPQLSAEQVRELIRQETNQIKLQVEQAQADIIRLLNQPTTSPAVLEQVRQALNASIEKVENRLAGIETHIQTRPAKDENDPKVEKEEKKAESDAMKLVDLKKLTGFIEQADELLKKGIPSFGTGQEFDIFYQEIPLLSAALKDALAEYKSSDNPLVAVISAAQERIDDLAKLMTKLTTSPVEPVLPLHPAKSAIELVTEAVEELNDRLDTVSAAGYKASRRDYDLILQDVENLSRRNKAGLSQDELQDLEEVIDRGTLQLELLRRKLAKAP